MDFSTRAFTALGVPDRDAGAVARLMVEADLLGYDTYRPFRMRQNVNRLRDGGCKAAATPRVTRETAATALVDGGNGLGHFGPAMARDLPMEKARSAGIGWVELRGGNHAGPAALYVRPRSSCTLPCGPNWTASQKTLPSRPSRPDYPFFQKRSCHDRRHPCRPSGHSQP